MPWKPAAEAPPKCPKCFMTLGSNREESDVVMPNILAFSTRCQDGVYKAMEKASEERVYQAAEMAGCDASDMAGLKITNMRDNMREGDIAAIPVKNAITDHMDRIREMNPNAQIGYGSDSSAGAEYARAAAMGRIADGVSGSILPRRGSQMHSTVRAEHGGREASVLQQSLSHKGSVG